MKEYIKTIMNEQGFDINPVATTMIEYLITSYTRNLTREALHVSSYTSGRYKSIGNKIYDKDLEVILRLTSKSIEKRTMTEALEVI